MNRISIKVNRIKNLIAFDIISLFEAKIMQSYDWDYYNN